jgi:hypothetical protein
MQQIRRWNVGDVYAPHDLSGVEQSKWKRLKQSPRPKWDVLDQLNLNPMDHYKVCWVEVWGEGRVEMQKLTERLLPELQHHVRIRYGDGQDQAQQGDRSPATQPAQDGQGCQKGHWPGVDSQCVQTPSSAHARACLPEAHEGLLGEFLTPRKKVYV